MRIALGIEYVGTHFAGWQFQPHARTIQGCVEAALSKVANHPVKVQCAGRTDAGVHSIGQVVHTDVEVRRLPHSWVLGTNANLPADVNILWMQEVDSQFNARFLAQARHYRYIILNRRTRSSLLANRVTWVCRPLNVKNMQLASTYLLGTHDFSSYRATACQAKSPVRTLSRLDISQIGDRIIIEVSANAFLYHMVRNIAGVLMAIGHGEYPPEWSRTVLVAKNRQAGGITAPAAGLYFHRVDYLKPYIFPKSQLVL